VKKIIIIGAGTSGLTIANQLNKYFEVVVLEKNTKKKYPIIYRIPLLIGLLFNDSRYILKRSIKTIDNGSAPFFESKLLGGASVINGCVHAFGSSERWRKLTSVLDLSYQDICDSYKKIFVYNQKLQGKISLTKAPSNVLDKAFFKALSILEIPMGDMSLSDEQICGPLIINSTKRFRSSVFSLLKGKEIKIITGQKVKCIDFDDNGKVFGVTCGDKKFAADYVISSAGVIGTVEMLTNIRIGLELKQKYFLSNLKIGHGVMDHPNIRIKVLSNKAFNSLNEISNSLFKKSVMFVNHIFGSSTLMRSPGATSAVYMDFDGDGLIDTKIQVLQFSEIGRLGSEKTGNLFSAEPGFSLAITLINPESRGKISISDNETDIDPFYLSTDQDRSTIKKSLKFCLQLLSSPPLDEFVKEIIDYDLIKNTPLEYAKSNLFSGYHLIGGACASKSQFKSVVDEKLKVRNVSGLYVCDASVLSTYVSSNIHASVILLSDSFAKNFINEKNNIREKG
jgi:choline dehydrogenase-like flavoprotein